MTDLSELSRHFHPVQPRFREGGGEVMYREFLPDTLLSGYICCYWQLTTSKPLSGPFLYTAVADGCIDFFFDLQDPAESFVMGFSSGYTSFPLKDQFNYAGIRFFPGTFPVLYNVKASELTNQCQHLGEVAPRDERKLQAILEGQHSMENIKPMLDEYFKAMVFSKAITVDLRFAESLRTIFRLEGSVPVEKGVLPSISPRHLRRLFDFYIGVSPKEFNRIVRFQKFLSRTTLTREVLRKEKSYYDSGYYDQSHFIKEFKTLYGTNPLKAFNSTVR